MSIAQESTYYVSKEQLKAERQMRLQQVAARKAQLMSLATQEERTKSFIEDKFSAPEVKKIPVMKALASITDSQMRYAMEDTVVKAVESYDLTGIRFVSYYDQVAELANQETVFRSIIEANGIVRSTDFQVRWRENYANAGATVQFFNLNAGLPQEAEMLRAVRGNTMGAYGNQLNIRFITDELASQSPIAPTDERATQLRMQLIRMKRFSNSALIANSEIVSEIIGDTPQWGGFSTRSTLNSTVLGAPSDLTSALIQTTVNQIANAGSVQGLGYHLPLMALTTSAQIGKVRDLMIARFPGEKSNSFLDYQALMQSQFPSVDLPANMVKFYQPDPGRAVAFVHEPQLPSGLCLFFDPMRPRIAKFQMMNQFGPFALERPTPELTTLLVVFDFETLIDPIIESRGSITNLN